MNFRMTILSISIACAVTLPLRAQDTGSQVENLSSDPSQESEQRKITDEDLIRATLTDYIEGSTNGQPDRLRKAFHPDLNLYYVKNGRVAVWSGKGYIKDTKQGQPTGETGKILSIDFENDAAVAKVEISNPKDPIPYIDYFMLLKAEGKWTIIHKMFTKKTSGTQGGNVKPATEDKSSNTNDKPVSRRFHSDRPAKIPSA